MHVSRYLSGTRDVDIINGRKAGGLVRYADSGWSSNDLRTKRSMSRCVMRYAGGALSQAVQAPTEWGAGYRRTLCCLVRQERVGLNWKRWNIC